MELFDSHCHMNSEHFSADRDNVIAEALKNSVQMLTCGTCVESSVFCAELAETHENVYAAVGIHPNHTGDGITEKDYEELRRLLKQDRVVAIGETGLDWYWDSVDREVQQEHFRRHLELAVELQLPVIVHARDSADDCLDMIEPYIGSGVEFVWHCFIAGKKKLQRLLDRSLEMGLYLGISGIITYPEQVPLRNIIIQIPDKHLLLDTDAPYLIPKPRTVDRNEPTQALRIAQELAVLRGVSVEDIARITTMNARNFLKLDQNESHKQKVAYQIRDSLYLNLTNRCTNNCTFCARNQGFVVKGHDISLDHEPDAQEVIAAMGELSKYKEVVFCGYGEPTMCLDVLLAVGRHCRENGITVRLNTNGLANLYFKRSIVPELAGVVDQVSISLNSADPVQYDSLCRSQFGLEAHAALLEFARECNNAGIDTTLTVVAMPDIDVEAAEKLVKSIGVKFRARSFVDAG